MATTRYGRRFKRRVSVRGTQLKDLDIYDYSKGINSYVANDVLPLDALRKAQDARISTLGRYTTRKGATFYSAPAGETQDDSETSTTGAADQTVSTTTWKAIKFTTTAAGRLTKVDLNLKTNDATAPLIVEIYSDSSSEPGTLLATSSIPFSDLGSSYAYETARFIQAPELTISTDYWIVIYVQDGSGSYYASSNTNATTALTSADSGGTWSATAYDLNFKTYISTDGATKGLYRANQTSGTGKTLLAHGTVLYSVNDVTGALSSVKTGLSSSATRYRFETINDKVYYVNGYDAPRVYDFSTDSAAAWGTSGGSTPPVASLVVAHQDLLFFNDTTDPNRLEFSDETSYETAASTNFRYFPHPNSSDPIVALVSLNDVLYVFTTRRKFALYGTDKATFQTVELPSKGGTYSQETVAVVRNHIYYMASDGFRRFNGVEDELLSATWTDKYEAISNPETAVMGVNKNRIHIYYRSSGSSDNDSSLVYNVDYETLESEDTNQYVNAAVQWDGGTDSFEYTTASSLVGQASYVGQSANDYSDMGSPLSFELRTGYFHGEEPNAKKIWKRWYPRFIKQSRSYDITCSVDEDFVNSPTTYTVDTGASGTTWGGGATWGGGSTYGSTKFDSDRIHLPNDCYYLQLRISKSGVNTPVEFVGHKLMYTVKRLR